jgi:hypothetical protein
VHRRQVLVPVAEVVLADCPVAYPSGFSSSAIVASRAWSPTGAAGIPTLERPVRNVHCPVRNAERPAVQLCSA